MVSLFIFTMIVSSRPVIELDEVEIEGEVRRPNLIELEASKLDEKLQESALFNLISLEKRLLKPLSPETYRLRKPR